MDIKELPVQMQMSRMMMLKHAVRQQINGNGALRDDCPNAIETAKEELHIEGEPLEVYLALDKMVRLKFQRIYVPDTETTEDS